ncbi:hypothetical protein LQL77_30265 [Rhodococcus cerastii]|nr:hypothetical protein [Rhodococcus cerastii]
MPTHLCPHTSWAPGRQAPAAVAARRAHFHARHSHWNREGLFSTGIGIGALDHRAYGSTFGRERIGVRDTGRAPHYRSTDHHHTHHTPDAQSAEAAEAGKPPTPHRSGGVDSVSHAGPDASELAPTVVVVVSWSVDRCHLGLT